VDTHRDGLWQGEKVRGPHGSEDNKHLLGKKDSIRQWGGRDGGYGKKKTLKKKHWSEGGGLGQRKRLREGGQRGVRRGGVRKHVDEFQNERREAVSKQRTRKGVEGKWRGLIEKRRKGASLNCKRASPSGQENRN